MGANNTKLSQMQFKPVEEDFRATIRFMSRMDYNSIGVHCIGCSDPDGRVLYVKGSVNRIEDCNHAIVEGDCNHITSKGTVVVTGSFNIIHAKSVEICSTETTTNFICWCGRDEKLAAYEYPLDGDLEIKNKGKLDKTYASKGCCLKPITVQKGIATIIQEPHGRYASNRYEKIGELKENNLACYVKSNGRDFNNLDVLYMATYGTIDGSYFVGIIKISTEGKSKNWLGYCKEDMKFIYEGLVVELRDGKRQVFNGDPPSYDQLS